MAKRKMFSRSHLVLATVVLASFSAAVPAMGAQGGSAFTKPGGPTYRAPKPTATQGQGAAVLSAAVSPQVIELMKKQEILDKLVDRITGGRSLAVALSILVIVSSSLPTRSGDLLVGRA
ncbi:hypothetical protein [Kitasatospora sp. NPDC005751]|uniref:hypothetical protein n=1 Tax=Kitasatospora sp. NPDC005751 TaxID=3157064 RepID=UPI0033E732E9